MESQSSAHPSSSPYLNSPKNNETTTTTNSNNFSRLRVGHRPLSLSINNAHIFLFVTLLVGIVAEKPHLRRNSGISGLSHNSRSYVHYPGGNIGNLGNIWQSPESYPSGGGFSFASVSGSNVVLSGGSSNSRSPSVLVGHGQKGHLERQREEISSFEEQREDTENVDVDESVSLVNKTSPKTKGVGMMDMDQIMSDMGVWDFHLKLQQDSSYSLGSMGSMGSNQSQQKSGSKNGKNEDNFYTDDPEVDANIQLSTVKIIPDEHHVSAFLNKGVLKRFLFINDKLGNPLSITITPCTSILLWTVKFWAVSENGTQPPEHVKTYRTQRSVTFTESSAFRGVYSIDIKAINWDSYVHFYATSHHPEPIRVFPPNNNNFDNNYNFNDPSFLSLMFPDTQEKFYQHIFTESDPELKNLSNLTKSKDSNQKNPNFLNIPTNPDTQTNTNLNSNQKSLTNKPQIWSQRLRGNRLHVKWDTSPVNPHLMNYCIVVNTRRDYSSLCSASGERFGVLPPDLMHVTYYGGQSDLVMVEGKGRSQHWNQTRHFDLNAQFQSDGPTLKHRHHNNRHKHRHHHGQGQSKNQPKERRHRHTDDRRTNEDIIIGCVNKKTNYILSNLREGRLYYFNVFLRDLSTNVSYPYLRTTLKYQTPKTSPNALRDAKPTKVKLDNGQGKATATTVKFNLNKPCSELSIYVMPCGGGSISYEALHGNRSVYKSGIIDSLDIIKIAVPLRGKYFIKIDHEGNPGEWNWARMAEVYVGKKNRRLPLPKLPAITKISEDESLRTCDSVTVQWWPSPDERDNEYCIFLKEESRKRLFQFKKPNQCDVERSLKSDPYVTHSLCVQRTVMPETMLLSQKIVGLQSDKTYVIQLILRRHNGKSLSYDLHFVKTLKTCSETN